jgi:hypothetical protein
MQTANRPSSYQKLTYIQKVSRINRNLRVGDISRIAESTGFSSTHVSDVASGRRFNERIVNSLYDLTRKRISNPQRIQSLQNSSN